MEYKALLLDRDGVINTDHGYVHKIKDFEFTKGIFDLSRFAHAMEYKIIVITNQAGIARGLYTEQQFHDLTAWMCREFARNGAPITKVYYSPYHPTEGIGIYRKDDFLRKPNPGMILLAKSEYNLNLNESVLIGDKPTDIKAGLSAGVRCNMLFGEAIADDIENKKYRRIKTLEQAIDILDGKLRFS
jgi:D-glycero-D-manno-heptose 1,7-bisphosphate phosphatase